MNLFTLIVSAVLALLLAAFSVLLMAAILFNLHIGRRYRRRLALEFDRLRLSRMLSALGLDIDRYLHRERIVDIRRQMQRCADCAKTAECDDSLAAGAVDSGKIGFCDNEKALLKMLDQEPGAASSARQ